jgi:hypothetical protein
MDSKHHWNAVFSTQPDGAASWFELLPETSIRLMEAAGLNADTCVIDVGGGDSRLVDHLAARGLDCLAVLDVSGAALARARSRLGRAASVPMWLETDVAGEWSVKPMDIWHDRAVFHFLIATHDRERYCRRLSATLKAGGSAIFATFALDGPDRCSGLPVQRYSAETLAAELGEDFELLESLPHVHRTPSGQSQSFVYCRFRRRS